MDKEKKIAISARAKLNTHDRTTSIYRWTLFGATFIIIHNK
jgi:hypothetical protein